MRSEKRILKSLGTNNFEMRGFFCGRLNPCTCQAAPALNVWLVQHLMLRRNYLHSSIQSRHLLHNLCHNGLHLSAARSMKAQATSKRQLWQQNQKHQTSSRLLTVELIMCIVRMWITPSSNLYDIHIYTFRLSGSASSFHTPKVTSPHNIQRIWVLQSSQVAGILSQNMWTERARHKTQRRSAMASSFWSSNPSFPKPSDSLAKFWQVGKSPKGMRRQSPMFQRSDWSCLQLLSDLSQTQLLKVGAFQRNAQIAWLRCSPKELKCTSWQIKNHFGKTHQCMWKRMLQ